MCYKTSGAVAFQFCYAQNERVNQGEKIDTCELKNRYLYLGNYIICFQLFVFVIISPLWEYQRCNLNTIPNRFDKVTSRLEIQLLYVFVLWPE